MVKGKCNCGCPLGACPNCRNSGGCCIFDEFGPCSCHWCTKKRAADHKKANKQCPYPNCRCLLRDCPDCSDPEYNCNKRQEWVLGLCLCQACQQHEKEYARQQAKLAEERTRQATAPISRGVRIRRPQYKLI